MLDATDPGLASRDHIAHLTRKQTRPLTVVCNHSSVTFAAEQESYTATVLCRIMSLSHFSRYSDSLGNWPGSYFDCCRRGLIEVFFYYLHCTALLSHGGLTDVHFIKDSAERWYFEVLKLPVVCATTKAPKTDNHQRHVDDTGLYKTPASVVSYIPSHNGGVPAHITARWRTSVCEQMTESRTNLVCKPAPITCAQELAHYSQVSSNKIQSWLVINWSNSTHRLHRQSLWNSSRLCLHRAYMKAGLRLTAVFRDILSRCAKYWLSLLPLVDI